MSYLYPSPEVTSLGLLTIERSRGSRIANYAPRAPNCRAARFFHTDCHASRSSRAPPQSSGSRCCINSFRLPKQAQVSRVIFSSAISGFRSLCGRKQRSSLKPSRSIGPAFWNLSLGAGSRFENPGLHP